MSKIKELVKSGHIHVALALGISIIALAYVSKRMLAEPISPLYLGIPSFIMLAYETLLGSKKKTNLTHSIYWVIAIVLATAIIIGLHLI